MLNCQSLDGRLDNDNSLKLAILNVLTCLYLS